MEGDERLIRASGRTKEQREITFRRLRRAQDLGYDSNAGSRSVERLFLDIRDGEVAVLRILEEGDGRAISWTSSKREKGREEKRNERSSEIPRED